MSPEFITSSEFSRWAESLDKRLDVLEQKVDARNDANSTLKSRVAVLEDRSNRLEENEKTAKTATGIISLIVSALVSGLMSAIKGASS